MKNMIRRVQRAYPQIWFACHVQHRTRRSESGLTDREVGILEHIEATSGCRASDLALHLGIGKPALSAQLKKLAAQGLIELATGNDAREKRIALTPVARNRLIDASPLDAARIDSLLQTLSPAERRQALSGIELLAEGARRHATKGKAA